MCIFCCRQSGAMSSSRGSPPATNTRYLIKYSEDALLGNNVGTMPRNKEIELTGKGRAREFYAAAKRRDREACVYFSSVYTDCFPSVVEVLGQHPVLWQCIAPEPAQCIHRCLIKQSCVEFKLQNQSPRNLTHCYLQLFPFLLRLLYKSATNISWHSSFKHKFVNIIKTENVCSYF